ncbi:MAG TPA: hypothetical protein VFR24_07115 [Candidatus Angelobacter sp.]|nr:hypothetical protein [Candidatus Angelobacter sp.]
MWLPNSSMKPVTWNSICDMFVPFAGSCLYSIRADAFFHLAQAGSAPAKFAAKNSLYPAFAWGRAARARRGLDASLAGDSRYLFVCDYAAEPGFGTLRPLLQKLGRESLFAGLDGVMQARAAELTHVRAALVNLDAEMFASRKGRVGRLWTRAQKDFNLLLKNCPQEYQRLCIASRNVMQTLLVRAYLYREVYERLFAENRALAAVITHNDFTTSSYLACLVAREMGVKSFTLQHGFPTQEYFPTSADHYLVWGQRFHDYMVARPGMQSNLIMAGAPRFDGLAKARNSRSALRLKREENGNCAGRCDVVFFSQSHSPLFTEAEHRLVLAALKPLLDDHRFHVVVRLHPQETEKRFRRLSGFDRITIAPRDLSLQETLSSADVAISCNSTAMLEAMAVDVPVVQIAPEELQDRLGIIEPCGVARNCQELRQCLQTFLLAEGRRIFMEKQNQLLHGYLSNFPHATDAVYGSIEEELVCNLDVVEAKV